MEGGAGGGPLSMMLMFALIFGVFYFLVIMPAKKQQRKKEAMISALKKGDKVVTSGGIYGTVAAVEDQTTFRAPTMSSFGLKYPNRVMVFPRQRHRIRNAGGLWRRFCRSRSVALP